MRASRGSYEMQCPLSIHSFEHAGVFEVSRAYALTSVLRVSRREAMEASTQNFERVGGRP